MSRQCNNASRAPATRSCLTSHEIYRDELRLLGHGFPLWDLVPGDTYRRVEIGDVGFLRDNTYFNRIFNILLAPDDPSHIDGVPKDFRQIRLRELGVRSRKLSSGILTSQGVRASEDGPVREGWFSPSDGGWFTVSCKRPQGAGIVLPQGTSGEDIVDEKAFMDYIIANSDSWLAFTESKGFGVDMEDILLVTGRDLTSSWIPVVFTQGITKIQLPMAARWPSRLTTHGPCRSSFGSGVTEYVQDNKNQCIFLRGFRAKRRRPFKIGNFLNLGPSIGVESLSGPSAPDSAVAVLDYILGASLTQKITRIARWEPAVDIAIFYEGPQPYPSFGEDQSPGYESVRRMLSRSKPAMHILDEEKRAATLYRPFSGPGNTPNYLSCRKRVVQQDSALVLNRKRSEVGIPSSGFRSPLHGKATGRDKLDSFTPHKMIFFYSRRSLHRTCICALKVRAGIDTGPIG